MALVIVLVLAILAAVLMLPAAVHARRPAVRRLALVACLVWLAVAVLAVLVSAP